MCCSYERHLYGPMGAVLLNILDNKVICSKYIIARSPIDNTKRKK